LFVVFFVVVFQSCSCFEGGGNIGRLSPGFDPVFVPDKSSCDGFELAGRGVLWIERERERQAFRYEYLAVQIGSFLGRSLASDFSSKKGNR
jgi:hypothetical protein